jgi:hypothetical protein
MSSLRRTPTPDPERLADVYLVDLQPVKIQGLPSVSIASYRKDFCAEVQRLTEEIDQKDGDWRLSDLVDDLYRTGQIGQLLGFANEPDNLYRKLFLARIGKGQLFYMHYWDSMQEYESHVKERGDPGDEFWKKRFQEERDRVTWLIKNRDLISQGVAEWRLLFRIDSNREMNLNMMDGDPLYVFIRDEDLAQRNFSDLAGEVTQG